MAVMQQSGDLVFHGRDTPIWFGLLWQSYTSFSVLTLKPLLGVIEAILLKP